MTPKAALTYFVLTHGVSVPWSWFSKPNQNGARSSFDDKTDDPERTIGIKLDPFATTILAELNRVNALQSSTPGDWPNVDAASVAMKNAFLELQEQGLLRGLPDWFQQRVHGALRNLKAGSRIHADVSDAPSSWDGRAAIPFSFLGWNDCASIKGDSGPCGTNVNLITEQKLEETAISDEWYRDVETTQTEADQQYRSKRNEMNRAIRNAQSNAAMVTARVNSMIPQVESAFEKLPALIKSSETTFASAEKSAESAMDQVVKKMEKNNGETEKKWSKIQKGEMKKMQRSFKNLDKKLKSIEKSTDRSVKTMSKSLGKKLQKYVKKFSKDSGNLNKVEEGLKEMLFEASNTYTDLQDELAKVIADTTKSTDKLIDSEDAKSPGVEVAQQRSEEEEMFTLEKGDWKFEALESEQAVQLSELEADLLKQLKAVEADQAENTMKSEEKNRSFLGGR
jgi:hypothetical protein